jgi:hypothetical protein
MERLARSVAILALLSGALLALAPVTHASRPPRFRLLAQATTYPLSDGVRFVAFQLPAGKARVLDTQRGTSFDEPVPSASDGSGACWLTAIGGEHLLWVCPSAAPPAVVGFPRRTFLVQSIVSRQYESVTGAEQFLNPFPEEFVYPTGVGRQWVQGIALSPGPHGNGRYHRFLNWHTGQRAFEAFYPSFSRAVENPNVSSLEQRLCAPLHRYIDDSGGGAPGWLPFLYDRHYGVTRLGPDSDLVLWRCGQRRPSRLIRCDSSGCSGLASVVTSGAGRLTWLTQLQLRAYSPSSRRSVVWSLGHDSLPPLRKGQGFNSQTHTATRIFYAYSKDPPYLLGLEPTPGPHRVFIRMASLPR